MKKLPVVLCALFVLSAGPAFAQKGLVTATRALRQGFIGVPKALVKVNARGFFAVSKPFSAKAFKTPDAVRLSAVNLGVRESLRVSAQYQAHLKKFLEIKKEMDIFLGYQKLEPQHISAFEVHSRMNDLAQAEKELAAMERIVGPKEAGIHLGRSYLYQARMALQPNYASLYSKTEEKPTNSLRSFNADQFLLKDPDGTSLTMKDTSPGSDGFIRARCGRVCFFRGLPRRQRRRAHRQCAVQLYAAARARRSYALFQTLNPGGGISFLTKNREGV